MHTGGANSFVDLRHGQRSFTGLGRRVRLVAPGRARAVTELSTPHASLSASERRRPGVPVQAVLELLAAPAFVYDVGGERIVEANTAAATRLGCSVDELKRRSLEDVGVLDQGPLAGLVDINVADPPSEVTARRDDGYVVYVDTSQPAAPGARQWELVTISDPSAGQARSKTGRWLDPNGPAESFDAQVCAVLDATAIVGVAVLGTEGLRANATFTSMLRLPAVSDVASFVEALPEPIATQLSNVLKQPNLSLNQRLGRVRFEESGDQPEPSEFLVELWLSRRGDLTAIVARDVTEQLSAVRAHRRLVASALHARAEDRRSIAGQLHDGPVQLLASISLEMGLLRRAVSEEHATRLSSMERRLGESVVQLRTLVRSVVPDALSAGDLAPELQGIFQAAGLLGPEHLEVELPPGMDELALAVVVDTVRAVVGAMARTPVSLRLRVHEDAASLQMQYGAGQLRGFEGRHVLDMLSRRLDHSGVTVRVSQDRVEVLVPGAAFDEGTLMPGLR
ncbi:MAG: Histidine kinase [Acidimicrobiia bacterium]|nr:Histidine kinase [Acidimicrobiia bacterium]